MAKKKGRSQGVADGYERLEQVLLERALHGTEKLVTRRDGSEERVVEISNDLGLKLLKMHRDTAPQADAGGVAEDVDEARERVVAKLMRLKQRIEKEDSAKG